MTVEHAKELNALLALPADSRLLPLIRLGGALADAADRGQPPSASTLQAVTGALAELLQAGAGDGRARVELGDVLGRLGDPRLRLPSDPEYWAVLDLDGERLRVGRNLVTNWEWRRFVAEGGYENDAWWSEEGRSWRDRVSKRWPDMAAEPERARFLFPNQPVVGVTWYEAEAYANSALARLPEFAERTQIMRGLEKRPYPWGEPFGHGNAATREEVLGRPVAIGLFRSDMTPDGVWDLAGNVAEWTLDIAGDKRVLHPGSWKQPSMASWAKAIAIQSPDYRSDDLGFRIVADAS